ncbi:hypothetical protein OS493_021556 [Desmophyllum pertusum]|uniref:Uncharacterized protein n=1 Tax=Desmophyllum pertusum TaxID=174260 RepID=A0A9W9YMR6_9CNID|nr:hypothetical protein OS493_021556 [Desmophyllum pertusum]
MENQDKLWLKPLWHCWLVHNKSCGTRTYWNEFSPTHHPLLYLQRARQVTVGTNPISVAAPGKDGDSFVLDMATSAVALGKVEMAKRKTVEISSWVGSGFKRDWKLSILKTFYQEEASYHWVEQRLLVVSKGQCFVAVNPAMFAGGFEDRMQSLMDHCRNLQPAEGETAVLVAGDPERAHMHKVKQDGGIHYHVNMLEAMDKLADRLGIPPMPTKA